MNYYKLNSTLILSNTDGIILVYDVTKTATFRSLQKWFLDIQEKSNYKNIPIIIVGNKTDLTFLRCVDFEEGNEKAFTLDTLFEESSCINSEESDKPFKNILSKLILNDLDDENKKKLRKSIELTENEDDKTIIEKKISDTNEQNNSDINKERNI